MRTLYDLIGALAGGGTPRANLTAAAPLLLQSRTVIILVRVRTGVGCRRQKRPKIHGYILNERVKKDSHGSLHYHYLNSNIIQIIYIKIIKNKLQINTYIGVM